MDPPLSWRKDAVETILRGLSSQPRLRAASALLPVSRGCRGCGTPGGAGRG